MNHATITLTITAIVAAAALASVAFAAPQVMAHKYNHNNNNGIKVDQQINQANQCNGQQQATIVKGALAANASAEQLASIPPGSTVCLNLGSNSADIGH